MQERLSFHELMGLPAYLLEEHLDITEDTRSPADSSDDKAPDFSWLFKNDAHITAAALSLHPLLDQTSAEALLGGLHEASETGSIFELGEEGPDENRVHIVIEGRLRLIVKTEDGHSFEIGQCRPGQWLGFPNALRAFDETKPKTRWSKSSVKVYALPLGKVKTRSMSVSEFVSLLYQHQAIKRFVRHHLAIRFARRNEMFDRVHQSLILRMLPPADQEYLLQLGVIKRVKRALSEPGICYMAAKRASHRIALVLRGECAAFLPGSPSLLAGKFKQSDLVGYEGIVMPGEAEGAPAETIIIQEPDRLTDIYIASGSEVLEFYWYSFRWTIDDRYSVWKRLIRRIVLNDSGALLPEIICVAGASAGLGTTSLAHTVAAMLAEATKAKVCIVDAQINRHFESHWESRGFKRDHISEELRPAVRDIRDEKVVAENRPRLEYDQFTPTRQANGALSGFQWPEAVLLVSPKNSADMEAVVESLATRDDLRYLFVCMENDAERADDAARRLALELNARADMVLYVTDEPEEGYLFSPDVSPTRMTWVERMTPRYLQMERREARKALNDARLGDCLRSAPEPLRKKLIDLVGGLPGESSSVDFEHRRRVVRVPDDRAGATLLQNEGPLALSSVDRKKFPLKRAAERLVRVITRRTVGLALGGGGAWGYAHIALLKNLEEKGVPVDYIAGSSFGAIVGGLYAAGGMHALDRLLAENSLDANHSSSAFVAPFTSPLMRAVLLASFSAASLEWFVNSHLRRMGLNGGRPIGLGTTEIPFYPIGSNLDTYRELSEEHGTVGLGVRMSGTMPPVAPAFRKNGQFVVDGAFVSNVPSRYLREIGADFIIAVNAIPPAPSEGQPRQRGLSALLFSRFSDAMRANQLLSWKAGQDQAALTADYRMDLRPKGANVFDMWKGRAIVAQIKKDHFSGSPENNILKAWSAFHVDPFAAQAGAEEKAEGAQNAQNETERW